MRRAWPTIALVGISTLLSTVFGVLIGIAAAWKRGSPTDYGGTSFTMATYAMPDFWLGMLLLITFGVTLGLFPVGGITDPNSDATGIGKLFDQAHHMFLPALTLTLAYLGEYALVMRSSLLETMREDYLTSPAPRGCATLLVRNRHAVPNALLPVVTLIAINFGFVLSGAIAVETIFSWPGLGLATYEALDGPDLPMLQGLFLVFSAAVILFNLRRPALRLPRPAGADGMSSTAAPLSPRRLAWGRRRRARRRGVGVVPARACPGMIGLVVLLALRRDRAARAADRRRVRAPRDQHDRQPDAGRRRRTSRRSAPTTSGAACGRSSSGAPGSACSSASRRPCSRSSIGSLIGIIAGYAGGKADAVLMRITEWFLVIPFLPLAIVLASVLGPSVRNVIIVIGITSWPATARLLRAQVLTLKERLYVERSRALGAVEAGI